MSAIQIGDEVTIKFQPRSRSGSDRTYTVVTVKSMSPAGDPFWELAAEGHLYVIDTPVVLKKKDGAP